MYSQIDQQNAKGMEWETSQKQIKYLVTTKQNLVYHTEASKS